jgi:hypothetical protein
MYFREWNFSVRGDQPANASTLPMLRLNLFLLIGFD